MCFFIRMMFPIHYMLLFTQGWLCILLSLESMHVWKTLSAAAQTETSHNRCSNVKAHVLYSKYVHSELVV